MNPHRLNICIKAYNKAQEREDYNAWNYGRYVYQAFSAVLASAFGSKSKVEYPSQPYSYEKNNEIENKEGFDEEDIEKAIQKEIAWMSLTSNLPQPKI